MPTAENQKATCLLSIEGPVYLDIVIAGAEAALAMGYDCLIDFCPGAVEESRVNVMRGPNTGLPSIIIRPADKGETCDFNALLAACEAAEAAISRPVSTAEHDAIWDQLRAAIAKAKGTTMAEHTPGPLTVEGPFSSDDLADYDRDYAILSSDGWHIGTALGYVHHIRFYPAEENATLWAAAPDLLAACEAAVDILACWHPRITELHGQLGKVRIDLWLAIAKAKGGE